MASGWPVKSTLVPIYALVASFLLVFLAGMALKKESQPIPISIPVSPGKNVPPPPVIVGAGPAQRPVLITVNPDANRRHQDPAMGIENVIIWQEAGNREIPARKVGPDSWIYQPTDAVIFKVCLKLKQGWVVATPMTTPKDGRESNTSCTNPVDGHIDFIIGGER